VKALSKMLLNAAAFQLIALTRWRIKYISNKNFILLASMIVGIVSGLGAVVMKELAHSIENFVDSFSGVEYSNYLYFISPAIGILLTVFIVQFVLKGTLGRGIGNVIYSIARKKGKVPVDKTYTHIITSALTVGFGGSAGLEAPIVVTGSAIGSNIAQLFHLSAKERILLLACGTAAGISAIFNSPIAGVIFSLEVLLVEMSIPAFIPLLIASATGTVVSKMMHNRQLFHLITEGWEERALPFYILLGLFCGVLSAYITKSTLFTEGWIDKKKSIFWKAVMGGIALGVIIFFLPPLYGEGYRTIEYLMKGQYHKLLDNSLFYGLNNLPAFLLLFTAILILIKVIATSITIACGGNGGIFATSMFTGSLAGFFCSYGLNSITNLELNETNFVAAGMAGILSGVIHAPLTAIFLIAEITGGYVLFVPLMIVSATSFFVARYIMPHTIYTKKLMEKGDIHKSKDGSVLSLMKLDKILEMNFITLTPENCLGDIVKAISQCKRNIFPVIDENGFLKGVLFLDDIREIMFQNEHYTKVFVKDLMKSNYPQVTEDESMNSIMSKFEDHGVFNLPVVKNGIYRGFISRSNTFTLYRDLMIEESKPLGNL